MGVRILYDSEEKMAALYCSTSDHAFGPIFNEDPKSEWSAAEEAEFFLRWLSGDARDFTPDELEFHLGRFRAAEPKECGWFRCGRRSGRHPREPQPATAWAFDGTLNKAHKDGFCSDECHSAAAEDADERSREAYYGGDGPATMREQYAKAAEWGRKA